MYRTRLTARRGTAGELRSTLRARGLTIAYQPIISLRGGTIDAMEALARWTTPSGASVSPAEFIPVAEESGLIGELGAQILTMAVRDAATWQSLGRTGVRVNVSAHELRTPSFYDEVMRTVGKVGLDPALLGLELTEAAFAAPESPALDAAGGGTASYTLARLRAAGVSLMLDDYGSDDAALAAPKRFRDVDLLKIDRSVLLAAETRPEAAAAMRRLVTTGHAHDLGLCAEGVENAAQHARVVDLGCDYAQGYHFARPTTPEMVPMMLQAWAPFLPA